MLGEFTNFEKRVWYDTHNVTEHLRQQQLAATRGSGGVDGDGGGSEHVLGLTLAQGWDGRHGTGKEGIEILLRLRCENILVSFQ